MTPGSGSIVANAPAWRVPGVVTEKRELIGGKTKTVFAYVFKVMAMGGLFECQTRSQELYDAVTEGEEVVARGRFETYNGSIRLVCTHLGDAPSEPEKKQKS